MKGINDVMETIANQLVSVISGMTDYSDYNVKVCSERVFLDDYAPKVADYAVSLSIPQGYNEADPGNPYYDMDASPEGYESPEQMPYPKTVFFVLKAEQGEINFAVWNCPITIQVVSEENSIDAARAMVMEFIHEYNFKYEDGMVQSYFTPAIGSNMEEMYTGFRNLMFVRGYIHVPEDGVLSVVGFRFKVRDGAKSSGWFQYPFLNMSFRHSASPDTQPIPSHHGSTQTLNRFTTQTFSISTYLWHTGSKILDDYFDSKLKEEEKNQNLFTESVLHAFKSMNRKFDVEILSNVENQDEDSGRMVVLSGTFVLSDASYMQDFGDLSPWSISFSRSED